MKNISIIGTAGVPAQYGGFETLAENLVLNANQDIQYTVFCSKKVYSPNNRIRNYNGANLKYLNLSANGLSSIFYDFFSMLYSLKSDVMLILGVSGCLFLPIIRITYRGKIITNIDGIEWKRNKWKWYARFILKLSEYFAVKFSNKVIADNYGIVEHVKQQYGRNALLIEYGADKCVNVEDSIFYKEFAFIQNKYAVSVCRIEPENNIHCILQAFSSVEDKQIVIVGNWENSEYGKRLFEKYSEYANIILLNPIYDMEKINFLRSHAYLYVHGHSAGGTNPSLVEAMNLGLPIFAFDCVYNRYTTEEEAFYWKNVEELQNLMEHSVADLFSVGEKMRKIAHNRYRWSIISKKYEDLYNK